MNTFFELMKKKIDDFALQLKEQLFQMSDLCNPHQLLEFEQNTEAICLSAMGDLLGFGLKNLIQNPDLRRTSINAMHRNGKKWRSKGLRKVRIRLVSGARVEVLTPYFVPDTLSLIHI